FDDTFHCIDHGVERAVLDIQLVLAEDLAVFLNDGRRRVRSTQVHSDCSAHVRTFTFSDRQYPYETEGDSAMETIDLTALRRFTRDTGQLTVPDMLDAAPMERVKEIEIDEEHI